MTDVIQTTFSKHFAPVEPRAARDPAGATT
jgi:hypothetical protein